MAAGVSSPGSDAARSTLSIFGREVNEVPYRIKLLMESSMPRSMRLRTSASRERIQASQAALSAISLPGMSESAFRRSVSWTSSKPKSRTLTSPAPSAREKTAKHANRAPRSRWQENVLGGTLTVHASYRVNVFCVTRVVARRAVRDSAARGDSFLNAPKFRQVLVRFAPEFLGGCELFSSLRGVSRVFCGKAQGKVSPGVGPIMLNHCPYDGLRQAPVPILASAARQGLQFEARRTPRIRTRAGQRHFDNVL